MKGLKELIATFFYLGYSPVASGTAGTLGAMALAFLLLALPAAMPYGAVCLCLVAVTFLIGLPLGGWAESYYGKKDPGPFVLDEVMGYFVPLCIYFQARPAPDELFAAFFLFRLFDVVKPQPARRLEKVKGGAGIMLDDLVAGLYSLIGLMVYHSARLNPHF